MQHLAFIMDGNRRFAKQQGVAHDTSYRTGKDAAQVTIEFCIKNNIKYLSLYTFSLENFKREESQQEAVFTLLLEVLSQELSELMAQGVRVRFIGDREKFPAHLRNIITHAENQTSMLDTLHLNILFCYGGKQELVHAVKTIATQVQKGSIVPEDITQEMLGDALWTAGLPNPDLIVRTSGVHRLSNFLLYQAAYSELTFLDCHWPEITQAHLQQCIDDFYKTKRSYGA